MSITLEIENIGGLRGKQHFSFRNGTVNIIESPNASGKTSIIKSLAAILSLPSKSYSASEEMVRLGLKASSPGEPDPLINIYEDSASIRLRMNDEEIFSRFQRWKEPFVDPEGNENFVFAGLLTRESRVVRQLAEGNDNFMWIVDTMSAVPSYEQARNLVSQFLVEASTHLDQMEQKKKQAHQLESELLVFVREQETVKAEYENAEKELQAKPLADREKGIISMNLSQQEKEKEKEIKDLETEAQKAEQAFLKPSMELGSVNYDCEKLEQQMNALQNDLGRFPESADIKKILEQADRIERQDVPNAREERGKKVGVFNLLDSVLNTIGSERQPLCPVCGSSDLDADKLAKQKDELKRQVAELDKKISGLIGETQRMKNEASRAENERKEKEAELGKIRSELQQKMYVRKELKTNLEHPKRVLESKKSDVHRAILELGEIRRELREVEERIKETEIGRRGLISRREALGQRLLLAEKNGEQVSKQLEQSSMVVIRGIPSSIDRAETLYKRWVGSLGTVAKYLDEKMSEQRQGAAKRFNAEISKLVKTLHFDEFDEVSLSEQAYNLQVVRKGGYPQTVTSLSGSERDAIAAILQIAVKETYFRKIPFFIIDDVMLDFDETRLNKIYQYLAELAKKSNCCLVVTKLAGRGAIRVREA